VYATLDYHLTIFQILNIHVLSSWHKRRYIALKRSLRIILGIGYFRFFEGWKVRLSVGVAAYLAYRRRRQKKALSPLYRVHVNTLEEETTFREIDYIIVQVHRRQSIRLFHRFLRYTFCRF